MEPNIEIAKAQERETRIRKRTGWLVAVIVFLAMYAVAASSDHTWGLALGWLPSAFLAAPLGWTVYCVPWIFSVIAALIALLGLGA
ncbi:hypothetical protein JQ629_22220 [Bradyrhizobium sp. AUGA SZCCT0222]|uniref:hypothetical protein n=1 Tax=Bradyrhizobium sp. AUGA SZCCT0222 TaxID=2807668 RepID=UPI001BABF0FB|nr:hypothetical protein [Bradyrhizobium sp. AUGA SZCCT0222]MBR1270197.1 hypothetical protein [Bradyrhizobium sp. AUGA SZCCT0222]